ncbi:MAG: metallophosphoesterase [Bryobacteraceae bacterium]
MLSLFVCAAGALFGGHVIGGPYVVFPGGRPATIAWVEQESEVKVGTDPAKLDRAIPVLHSLKVPLTGLKPGTTVHYQAFPGEEGKGAFKVPPAGAAKFEFVVFGDTRTRHDLHRRVVQAIAAVNPDFVLHTGDLVTDGYDMAQWPVFFGIEREMLRKTVFFPVLGNHERNNARFHEFFDVTTPYYSFDWGGAHFTLLNSDVANVSLNNAARDRFWSQQVRWMEEDLARNQKAPSRFVVMHHPPFTAYQKASHMSKEALSLVPLFEKYKVSAVLSGHDHTYQHHVKNGVHYVITGGGGAPLNPVDQPIPGMTVKVESIEHYVSVKVEDGRVVFQAVALDGRVIERFEIGAGAPDPAVSSAAARQ